MHLVWRYAYKELQKSLMMRNVNKENFELKQHIHKVQMHKLCIILLASFSPLRVSRVVTGRQMRKTYTIKFKRFILYRSNRKENG